MRSLLDAVGPSLLSATDLASRYGIEAYIWLIYSREKSFYLSYGKHWSRRLQSMRMRPAKGNIHTVIRFFRITTGANIFETLHLQLKYIAYIDTY